MGLIVQPHTHFNMLFCNYLNVFKLILIYLDHVSLSRFQFLFIQNKNGAYNICAMNILKPPSGKEPKYENCGKTETSTSNYYIAKTSSCIDESDDLLFSFDGLSHEKDAQRYCLRGISCPFSHQKQKREKKNTTTIPEKTKPISLQQSNSIFDPNAASPASDFIRLLQLRMSVYYEQEVNMFS